MKVKPMTEKDYNLNQGQKEASEEIFKFLFSPDKAFLIKGPAGVGKTYLMNYIIDKTMPRYMEMCQLIGEQPHYNDVVMTATTNKAAEVLQLSTKRPTQTIHSFLNLTVREDFSTGRMNLSKTRNWVVHHNKIIFVDECSMIDSDLFRTILEGTLDCKIIFVGDPEQLAPVMEKISPVYQQGYPSYELTEQMRNSGQPALMNICQELRMRVRSTSFGSIPIVPGVIDLLDDDQMRAMLSQHFHTQTLDARILGYTNSRVIDYNAYIRDMRNLPESYQAGELLVNNSAIRLRQRMLSVEEGIEVLRNHGPDKAAIEKDVYLDVDNLDIQTELGEIFTNVQIPTNRDHFTKLVKYYSSKAVKNWDRYYYLKQTFPDLRPRDAATVHKSQGSTYDAVFIDLENISTCKFPNDVARMLYVAFSRARNRVFLYGDLADKYGNLTY